LAALADGQVRLDGALWSEDTQVMADCLQWLGFRVEITPDSNEACNRTIVVHGLGGKIPNAGTPESPLELFVGNAGTAARFLAALVCLGNGIYRLRGVPRMHERPQAALFQALRQLGYHVEAQNERLPAVIHGTGPRSGECHVSIEESSQFVSALLLSSGRGGWIVNAIGENAEESPYVVMTTELCKVFPQSGGSFQVEPDASSGSYFLAAGQPLPGDHGMRAHSVEEFRRSVTIANWPASDWQVDAKFGFAYSLLMLQAADFPFGREESRTVEQDLENLIGPGWRKQVHQTHERQMQESGLITISRHTDLGDSIMTAIVMAPLARGPAKFTDLGRLRLQECERVAALRTELTKCGAKIIETGDTLEVFPSKLHGAEIETYNDHRMAMCFAILGLKVQGIRLKNPACVKKTFPNFFQKLAAKPPFGLGATILRGDTGQPLAYDELFAE